jgi:hypothetical protein
MDLKNYTSIITNLSIIITFIYSIILIIDELYNIGIFSFKYTYLYNYGTFTSDFNNIQTIECETNRFNIYSNNNYIYKDIFSKSYFNYLIIIAITLITVLFVLAYGINFYFTFIINQPEVCSFYKSTSFIKTIMKCLCDTCHEFIPDCTGNYLIAFIIIIIIPISYFLKSFLNIDITPNTTSTLFSFGYLILFILLLFTYSFVLFNINKTDNNSTERIINVAIYIFFTILFIISGYIFKYTYNKYTDISLNKTKSPETFFDIYKQSPPIKPTAIEEPIYKGINLLNNFKYDPNNKEVDYKQKKEIMDEYYISIKNYEKNMIYYTQKYNNYINSKAKLGDTTSFINITTNILGLNNKTHIYIIGLLILVSIIYYFYNNDLLFICLIYLISILTILTIINAILYYNTILNKYIIYEPQAYYKNDITNANTKFNLLLDPSNGDGFYNILTNNQLLSKSANINITPQQVITDVKSLTIFDNFTSTNISNINKNCQNVIIPTSDNIISPDLYDIYYDSGGSDIVVFNDSNIKIHIINKINNFNIINQIDIFYYNYNPITYIDIYYNEKKIRLDNLRYYNRYVYYISYLFEKLLIKLRSIYYTSSIKDIGKYVELFNKIQNNYLDYRLNTTNDTNLKKDIYDDINGINTIDGSNITANKLNHSFFLILDKFIKNNIIIVNKLKLIEIYDKVNISTVQAVYHFIEKLNISTDAKLLTFSYDDATFSISFLAKTGEPTNPQYYSHNIMDNISYKSNIRINLKNINKSDLFKFNANPASLNVKVPTKIIDNNYNELYIKSIASTALSKIIFKESTKYTKIKAYSYNYKFNEFYQFNKIKEDNITFTQSPTDRSVYINKTTFNAPYILKDDSSTKSSDNLNFKQIILSSLLYNLIHITSKYEYQALKTQLYYKISSPTPTIGTIERVTYDFFSTINIDNPVIIPDNFLTKSISSKTTEAYIVLLYNVYTYDKDRIIDIIEYFIYNNKSYNLTIYTTDDNLQSKILSIKTTIDKTIKTVDKSDLIKTYENNKYIVNLILKIYENLIKFIKKEIETNIDNEICHSTSATKLEIELQLYNHLFKYFTITNNNLPFTATYNTSISVAKQTIITKNITNIGTVITNFFNICIFLLDNIEGKDKIEEDNKETIVSNFKFYNTDDTISLDTSNMENIRKNLTINCDYYSKYNNLDKKQKNYMKINTDNVGFAFPVLLIIFVAIFGETAFIKS